MSLKVLQNNLQIQQSRKELDSKGISEITPPDSYLNSILRKLRLVNQVVMGDMLKSWDVLSTVNFLEEHVKKNVPILDIGCYASEVIIALHKSGFSNLTGADLNSDVIKMPFQNAIHYEVTNFMQTKFEDASFQAITSISVIEHDFNSQALLKEMSRLLMPGGYFIASFDYWPDKIDTTGIQFFDMDWTIFSKNEVGNFIREAATYGLVPIGDVEFDSKDRPIDCAGKQYTFAWLVLTKT